MRIGKLQGEDTSIGLRLMDEAAEKSLNEEQKLEDALPFTSLATHTLQ